MSRPYEECEVSTIRHAAGYEAVGLAGIDILYSLDSISFCRAKEKLIDGNILPKILLEDSTIYDTLNTEYNAIVYQGQKIAFPRIELDFCEERDTCFVWEDMKPIILEVGKQYPFSDNINPEYKPEGPLNYSIGALYSQQKKDVIYWLFIYD
jgi:hypothetical protein